MTLQHVLRTMIVAGVAALALVAAKQAHAEGGDGLSVYAATAATAEAAADDAPEGSIVEEAAEAESDDSKTGAAAKDTARLTASAGSEAKVRALIMRFASENNIPYGLADAVVRIESRYDAKARNGVNVGLTQINVQTAQSLGYKGPVSGLLDAETNLRYGLKYLAQAYKLAGGDTCGTVLRYQSGHRAQAMTGSARAYCSKVQTIIASADGT
jgi:soluble lytic murein transglycosylase-like protein